MALRLLWNEAAALLAFERGRAAQPVQAARAWLRDLRQRGRRLTRLGWRRHARMLTTETACRQAGLSFAAGPDEQRAPWHLPDHLATASAAECPVHPLIEPPADSAAGAALDAIDHVLSAARIDAFWRDRPTLPPEPAPAACRIAVCLHLFYPELWPELRDRLRALPEPWDLIVTVPAFANTAQLDTIVADVPQVRFAPLPNRGRDVLPWLQLLSRGAFDRYELVCKLHGKKSPHTDCGAGWRQQSVAALIGDERNAQAVLRALRADPSIGVLGPAAASATASTTRAHNKHLRGLARRLPLVGQPTDPARWRYFAGTMFWFRPPALRGLAQWRWANRDFEPEMAQTDGTMAHAVERCIGHAAATQGFRTVAWEPALGSATELMRPTAREGDLRADTTPAHP